MLEYDRINISEGININKTNGSKECDICHYWYFLDKNFNNEERNYRELKESFKMMNIQRSDTEKINLIEEGKNIGIDEVIKRN